jgi:hypothetical protein
LRFLEIGHNFLIQMKKTDFRLFIRPILQWTIGSISSRNTRGRIAIRGGIFAGIKALNPHE